MDFDMPDMSVQQTDAAKQLQESQELLHSKSQDYWEGQVVDTPRALQLPVAQQSLQAHSFLRSEASFMLSHPLAVALRIVSDRENTDLNMTLFTAFQALLFRSINQEELLVGLLRGDGFQREMVDTKQEFTHIFPVHVNLSGNPPFLELLARVQRACKGLDSFSLQAEDAASFMPYQAIFAFNATPAQAAQGDALLAPSSFGKIDGVLAKTDLAFIMWDEEQEIGGKIVYNPDLFEDVKIARMIKHWELLLEGIVADASQHITALPILTDTERHQQLVQWNATQIPYTRNRCYHELFEDQVERTPSASAVMFEDKQLTYQEVNQRANQLAHYLCRHGVGPNVLVGLCIERSLEMIIALLGILKAGGAYVPLDPTYPQERLAFMLQDAQPSVVVTQESLVTCLPAHTAHVICIDSQSEELASEETTNLCSDVKSDDLVYVIYTSGSTGIPKGILIEHRSLVNYVEYARDTYGLRSGERVLQFASINFDASAEEIFPCLFSGATLVLRTDAMLSSTAAFLQKCEEWGITVLDLPTAYWHEMVLSLGERELTIPETIRVVLIGGERALPERVNLWRRNVGRSVQLFNTYGPTETTIVATVADLSEIEYNMQVHREVSIGRPIANAQIYLLNVSLQPEPVGTPGEICIGGIGLARGYHQRSELTAERFIPDPFSDSAGVRLYRTGDLARYLPNGELEYLGRVDHQVKIRGYRIELGEIEAILSRHPAVRDVVVVAREDVPGDQRLVAYIALSQSQIVTVRDLHAYLAQQLPAYMIPSAFLLLDALPLNASGKVNRHALPAPDKNRNELQETPALQMLPVHQQLIDIWEELLNVRPIGIEDNFFELGGHSLLAVRLVDKIEQVWGRMIPPTTLLAGATIQQLADILVQPAAEQKPDPVTSHAGSSSRNGTAKQKTFISSIKSVLIRTRLRTNKEFR
jgi:amino acid adenylation domain-containing protein